MSAFVTLAVLRLTVNLLLVLLGAWVGLHEVRRAGKVRPHVLAIGAVPLLWGLLSFLGIIQWWVWYAEDP